MPGTPLSRTGLQCQGAVGTTGERTWDTDITEHKGFVLQWPVPTGLTWHILLASRFNTVSK